MVMLSPAVNTSCLVANSSLVAKLVVSGISDTLATPVQGVAIPLEFT